MSLKKRIAEYFFVSLGSFILALAINLFLLPIRISTGGVSGVATSVYYALNLPLSKTTLFLNILLFFFSFKTLKKDSVFKSVAGIIFLSLFLELTSNFGFYKGDILISSTLGGIFVGIGVGITVVFDGSTGGSDLAALIFHKLFPKISVATFILLIDSSVIVVSGVFFRDCKIMLYSLFSLFVSTRLTDRVIVWGVRRKK